MTEFFDPSDPTPPRTPGDKETEGDGDWREPSPWSVGDQLGDFQLKELLGQGSSGFVYRALDLTTAETCALKLLRPWAPAGLVRNKMGFRSMMGVHHPNLLRVDRIHKLGTCVALSMEEIDGVTFKRFTAHLRTIDPQRACEKLISLIHDFARGLSVMHARGYLHRDIKPRNLMVTRDGVGMIIDYGTVDSFSAGGPLPNARDHIVGTPYYMAPEVIWSQHYLPSGDIFSLGVVILNALRAIQRSESKMSSEWVRTRSGQQADKASIQEAIEELPESLPQMIRSACKQMLEAGPSDRPTAIALTRLCAKESSANDLWPVDPPLVGRAAEWKRLKDWIGSVFGGEVSRIHLTGKPGVGRSRMVEEIFKNIDSRGYGQVFLARCDARGSDRLDVFDQFCDAATSRYMHPDREKLQLDHVSKATMQDMFPVLANIMVEGIDVAPLRRTNDMELEVCIRFSEQLRLVGPLFLIVDNSQWADEQSLAILDHLRSATGPEGLGIITTAVDDGDRQKVAPDQVVHLCPLNEAESTEVLAHWVRQFSLNPTEQEELRDRAAQVQGLPARLRELAKEFRPGIPSA